MQFLHRLGLMAVIAIPLIMIYFMLRAEVFQDFGQTEDIVAALVIGGGSVFIAEFMWPRKDMDEDGS